MVKQIPIHKTLNIVFLCIFVFVCIIFPNDFLRLKQISFVILLLLNINLIFGEIRKGSLYALMGLLFPAVLFVWSFIIRGEVNGIFGGLYCCAMILLVAPIKKFNINYKRILMIGILVIAIWTFIMFFTDLIGVFNVNASSPLRDFIYQNDMGMLGKSSSYSLYYKIFLKASPLIVFLLAEAIRCRRWALGIFSLFVLFITGTRANIIFPIICFALYFCFRRNRKASRIVAIIIIVAMVLFFLILNFSSISSGFYQRFIGLSSDSDAVRVGHLQGLGELYRNNFIYFFTGTGIGSSFYSYSRGYVTTIEWAYLDLLRQIGIIFFVLFMLFILYPLRNKQIDGTQKAAYVAYLLIAFTNPLLFSSTGFLAYIYMYVPVSDVPAIMKEKTEFYVEEPSQRRKGKLL